MGKKSTRILAWDISLSCPGVALIEIKGGKIRVVDMDSCATNADESLAARTRHIEAWAHMFIRRHYKKGFDHIVREKYAGKFGHHAIFSAWNAVDRALNDFGLEVTEKSIGQSTVKKEVCGNGRASKDDVEAGVRAKVEGGSELHFKNDNESDAVAVGIAFILREGLI